MNKFEQVSSHDHQMSVAVGEGKVPCLYLGGGGRRGGTHVVPPELND